MSPLQHHIVILGGGIGDQLMAFPHLQALAKRSPSGQVLLITRQPRIMQILFAGSGLVADVFDRPPRGLRGMQALWRTARALARHRPPESWCLYRSSKLSAIPLLAGIRHRYGIHDGSWKDRILIPHGLTADEVTLPTDMAIGDSAFLTDALLARHGISVNREQTVLPPQPSALAQVDQYLATNDDRPLIALGINASLVIRNWGAQRFTDAAAQLRSRHDARFMLFGGQDVAPLAQALRADSRLHGAIAFDATDRSPGLAFEHALLSRCRMMISNDSFGLHLAALVGIPTIGLHGASRPLRYRSNLRPVESAFGWQSGRMDGITVEAVCDAAMPVLIDPP